MRRSPAHSFAGAPWCALVLVGALLAGCSSGCSAGCSSGRSSSALPADEAGALLIDRNWIDRMPETDRDRLHVYRFVPSMGGGVFQDRTLYKGTFELFSFAVEGDRIRFELHETQQSVTSDFRVERVDGPAPFDLKLTLASDPRGPGVYFGVRSETDRDGAALQQRLRAAAAQRP